MIIEALADSVRSGQNTRLAPCSLAANGPLCHNLCKHFVSQAASLFRGQHDGKEDHYRYLRLVAL